MAKKVFISCIKIFSALALSIIIFACIAFVWAFNFIDLNSEKLEKSTYRLTFYDKDGQDVTPLNMHGYNDKCTIDNIPLQVKNAFIAVEDKRFYSHGGIDFKAIARAAKNNILSLSFKEGGSTISQQLIKNTHLSNEKTFLRKFKELILTIKLEKTFDKDDIIELYLNTIFFGNNTYGIESASQYYFNKSACDLTINEGAALAATIKAPSVYNPTKEANLARKDLVLNLMLNQGYISEGEYNQNVGKSTYSDTYAKSTTYFEHAANEFFALSNISPYSFEQLEIYTNFDKNAQDALEKILSEQNELWASAIITDRNGSVVADYLPKDDVERMPASTIKPLLVYAPAIDMRVVSPSTKVLDEPTDFGGYSPSNYNKKYYGWTSVATALSNSLNIPSIKILESAGVEKCLAYTKKMGLNIEETTLNIALGAYSGGTTLKQLASAYGVFGNYGNYICAHYVTSAQADGKTIYQNEGKETKVFCEGTCDLMNRMLENCVREGTAKALANKDYQVCAKTGTNGTENGNSDAYTIAYTTENVIALRLSADNNLMPNNITGGYVSQICGNILDILYAKHKPANFKNSDEVRTVKLCKLCYDEGKIAIADANQPERYIIEGVFLSDNIPSEHSDKFTCPTVSDADIKVENGEIFITFNKSNYVGIKIIRTDQSGHTKEFTCTEPPFKQKTDGMDGIYAYSIIPYCEDKSGNEIFGNEVCLPPVKITPHHSIINDEWWNI